MNSTHCEICGKGPRFGHLVSHAHNLSKHKQYPNVHRIRVSVKGAPRFLRVCTRCLRSGKVAKAVS